jgi:phosphoglycerate dehydrogenase-like enzyme
MKFKKIIALDNIELHDESIGKIKSLGEEFIGFDSVSKSTQDTINRIKDADCVLMSFRSEIKKEVLTHCKNLKYIGLVCTTKNGVKEIDNDKISITNIFDYCEDGTAEYVFYQLLKHIREQDKPTELFNKTLGVIGFGAVGKTVANIAKGFGMKVLYNNIEKVETFAKFKNKEDLIQESDIITLHTPQNVKVLDKNDFNLITEGKILVNITLGAAYEDNDFLEWINKNENVVIMDACPSTSHDHKNIIYSNKVAARTFEAKKRLGDKTIKNIKNYLIKKKL